MMDKSWLKRKIDVSELEKIDSLFEIVNKEIKDYEIAPEESKIKDDKVVYLTCIVVLTELKNKMNDILK